MDDPRPGVSPAFLLFAACVFWGVATVASKALLTTVPPTLLLVIQLGASCIALWSAILWTKRPLPKGRTFGLAIGLGVLNPGISYSFNLFGLERVPASVASLLWATEPFLILALAWLILREAVTTAVIAVIAIGFLGVVFVSGVTGGSGTAVDGLGILFLLVAVSLCAIYTVVSRGLATTDALALVTVQQTAGLAWAALMWAATAQPDMLSSVAMVPPRELAFAAMTGLLYYAAAYWLYLSALGRVTAALAGGSFNIIPVVTIAVAYVALGERLDPWQLLGAALILVSAVALFWLTRAPTMSAGGAGDREPRPEARP